ncbi:MAG: zf-TFIIB domain-containing protein [Cyanobacteria bacterium NC_groundwater_1444_Ag_S-0.65um_54_12]|nr:zf-TFIIB domain-containing protein [Cyanobacteria bacterium NC_groundwater_1444_Ag_S-0.65um_54_12]
MRCPKCGGQLEVIQHENIEVDRCKDCSGIWLDAGELEYLTSTTKSSTFFGFLTRRKS